MNLMFNSKPHLNGYFGLLFIGSNLLQPILASVIIDVREVGSDVVATATGTLDLSGRSSASGKSIYGRFSSLSGGDRVSIGSSTSVIGSGYAGLSATTFEFASKSTTATSGSGLIFELDQATDMVYVPSGSSGILSINSSSTWTGYSISSLGLTPGTYQWDWTGGTTTESFTLNIYSPVPEPQQYALVAGMGLLGFALWRRKLSFC